MVFVVYIARTISKDIFYGLLGGVWFSNKDSSQAGKYFMLELLMKLLGAVLK